MPPNKKQTENLTPLITAFQNGTLTSAAVIAHVKNHANKNYQPGVEKVRLGMEALERADPSATLANIDHALLYRQLADGALTDAHGAAIQLANADELYGAKKVTEACAKIAYDDAAGTRRNFFADPKAVQKAVKAVTLAPPEDLTPLITAFQNGTLTSAAVIAHVKNHANKDYQPGVEKVRLGMEALERADPSATLANIDHALLYRQLADGALTDAHGAAIQLANADELNGAKKVTEACAKIAYDDAAGTRRNFFADPKAVQKAVKAVTLAPPEDLTPLITAFQNGTLTSAAVIAHVKNHANKNYQPGVEKVRLGMEALERADPSATLANIDHALLYRQLADGALTDAHGAAIQLANADELYGAKKVTEACAKIAYDDAAGTRRNFFADPKAVQKAVKAVTLAPPEDLTPLITAFQNGTLTSAAVIAHVKNHANKNYQPGVEKVRLGMEALERADPSATLANIDHALLYRQLADGALTDAHGAAIQLANADELYGAKKVTEACAKIAYDDAAGTRRNFFADPKAVQKAVKAVTLAPPEDLTPLITAFQNGTLTSAAVIAHVKNHANKDYQPGVEKVRLGMEALERADPSATLANIDHALLYRQLADGALTDAHGAAIQLANADELYGAKKVTEACAKIAYDDAAGTRHYLADPKAVQKAVKAVTLAPPEDLTPLITAFQNGTLTSAAVIAHVKNHANAAYQPGVEKVRLGMEALERADPSATLANIDHALLYRQLADGALTDAHGAAIQLANAHELYGAKKVTEACAKIAYDDAAGTRHYLADPKAVQKAVKAVTLAPPEDLTPLITAFQNGTLTSAAVIAHVKNHANKNYQPGVEKVRLGMEALERADPSATLANIDHALLYRQLADGALTDAHGAAIQLANAHELNGAKKVTEACAKIAYDDAAGTRHYLADPTATQKAIAGLKNPFRTGEISSRLDDFVMHDPSAEGSSSEHDSSDNDSHYRDDLEQPVRKGKAPAWNTVPTPSMQTPEVDEQGFPVAATSKAMYASRRTGAYYAGGASSSVAGYDGSSSSGQRQADSSTALDQTAYAGTASLSAGFMSYAPASVSGFSQGSGAAPPPSSLGTGSSGKRRFEGGHPYRPYPGFSLRDDELVTHPPSSHSGRAPYPGREQMTTEQNMGEFVALVDAYRLVRNTQPPLLGISHGGPAGTQADAFAPFQLAAENPHYAPLPGPPPTMPSYAPYLTQTGLNAPPPQAQSISGRLYPWAGSDMGHRFVPSNGTYADHRVIANFAEDSLDAGSLLQDLSSGFGYAPATQYPDGRTEIDYASWNSAIANRSTTHDFSSVVQSASALGYQHTQSHDQTAPGR